MPVAFSTAEREHITDALKAAGRRQFATVGLKKTSLADLVAAAGIVKSTFYQFYDCKEALYLELLLERASHTRRLTVDEGLLTGENTVDALRRFLRAVVEVLDSDPLYRRLMSHPEEIAMVQRKLTPEAVAKAADNGMAQLAEFIAERRGSELPDTDPTVIIGALRTILLLPLHANEFGDQYPEIIDLTINALTCGLVTSRQ
jgi:AcrR family transcriptional regulator